jgi:hypothetical protein
VALATPITAPELEKLAGIHCTIEEVAGFFGCTRKTIYNRCQEMFDMGWEEFSKQQMNRGKVSLRRTIWREALKGEWQPLKMLAENHLDLKSDDAPKTILNITQQIVTIEDAIRKRDELLRRPVIEVFAVTEE